MEDDEEKLFHLRAFLMDKYTSCVITEAKSLQSGRRYALDGTNDLIILDMTMRNFDRTVVEEGGRPHHFAGREILRQMKRQHIATPTIIFTHFDRFGEESDYTTLTQLNIELSEKFPNYIGTVHYRNNVESWKDMLANFVANLGLK
ncbi:response regulator [Labrys sp. KB_33_2]|uniref:response regulator n=1 Tax=Labrys sp. KB_33_2 TaxID=3237479 RepID=UPI003F91D874